MINNTAHSNAVVYARFSSDNQNTMSIDAQVRACREYADRHGYNITQIYRDEAQTGTNANRAGYQSLLADAMEGKFSTVLIHKYDRISRDMAEQALLDRKFSAIGVQLIAVAQDFGNTKDGKLTRGITWALAEYYSANLSEEIRKGQREAALNGLFQGGLPPFGYDIVNQRYVINETEAYFVRKMFNAYVNGEQLSDIIREIRAAGIKGKRGGEYSKANAYLMLRNETYTGVYLYNKGKPNEIRIEGTIPAIISRELFDAAQRIHETIPRRDPKHHPLSGLVFCACGGKCHHNNSTNKHKYFRCSKCGKYTRAERLEEITNMYIGDVFTNQTIESVSAALEEYLLDNKDTRRKFEADKAKRINKAQGELQKILDGFASGAFGDNYALINDLINKKKAEIAQLEALECPSIPVNKVRDYVEALKDSTKTPIAFIDRIVIDGDEVSVISRFASEILKLTEADFSDKSNALQRILIIAKMLNRKYNKKRPKGETPKGQIKVTPR